MKITDACVYPYPRGNSSVHRLALEARTLGYDSIVAVNMASCETEGVTVLSGLMIADMPAQEVANRIKRGKGPGVVVSVQARDNGFNRAVCGMKGVHILRDIPGAEKYAFDHVAAKIAADNGTAIDLDLSSIIFQRGHAREKVIHSYLDILLLHHRFEFPLTISSGARSILDMRPVREVSGLCSLLGMDMPVVEEALAGVGRILTPKETAVKVIG
jgi:ribonuclease P/MRP protein subunit RPP1